MFVLSLAGAVQVGTEPPRAGSGRAAGGDPVTEEPGDDRQVQGVPAGGEPAGRSGATAG